MATSFAESGADLELVGITKRFPGFTAIEHLDLTIPAGSFFALLGPSGCGKTTTLRLIAGLEEPTAGRILIGGKDVTDTKSYRRPVNTVFQSYALFPHMSIIENVAFGLKRRGIQNAAGLAHEALRLVELDHLAQRRPAQLSGGQQQRVALARAVVNRPALLLLDEPLGALDLKLRRQMQIELKQIQGDVGLTFLHVTHDQEEAMTMADTIAVMNKGEIEQMGAPEELYELPRTAFVANFLGQSNLFTGPVVSAKGDDHRRRHRRAQARGAARPRPAPRRRGHDRRPTREAGAAHRRAEGRPQPQPGRSRPGRRRLVQRGEHPVPGAGPGLGLMTVFSQNMVFGSVVNEGAEVWLTWNLDHTFGLADDPADAPRFEPDEDTSQIATARRERLEAELEEA